MLLINLSFKSSYLVHDINIFILFLKFLKIEFIEKIFYRKVRAPESCSMAPNPKLENILGIFSFNCW